MARFGSDRFISAGSESSDATATIYDLKPTKTAYVNGAKITGTNVVSLLHFDGADAGTTFTDASGKVWTPTTVTTKTDQKVFGASSGYFNTGYISTPYSDDFVFNASDFTIDFRYRPLALTVGTAYVIFSNYQDTGNYLYCYLYYNGTEYRIYIEEKHGNTTNINSPFILSALSVNTWYHFALVRVGTVARFFLNGTKQGADMAFNITLKQKFAPFRIGCGDPAVSALYANAYIDEFRVTKGLAQWSTDFTPPDGPY